ncbi:hypothetical protein RHGRI_027888 [Rhododendron griersonianum]|uniref:Uncharacterized protein n=1 Tax=Rhododendron griersonianum TaxID=479676 RepID=A0AAV6J241_9ERIC|nr:hypothetical protein RHGRI_027888 [Rhododendron griersonianum]KAG5533837.1 hypothetical protein RHGRI_027888 [Rhododendron griersonianum]KAG5533838.1 hypothetical protein RHGRI_027888 [Rhododendron griersonianum]
MEQKHILLSALSVGVGVGVGLSQWAGYNSSSSVEGVTAEQIEAEIWRLVVDGKESKICIIRRRACRFLHISRLAEIMSERTRVLLTSAAYVHLKHLDVSKYTRNLSPASRAILLSGPAGKLYVLSLIHYVF